MIIHATSTKHKTRAPAFGTMLEPDERNIAKRGLKGNQHLVLSPTTRWFLHNPDSRYRSLGITCQTNANFKLAHMTMTRFHTFLSHTRSYNHSLTHTHTHSHISLRSCIAFLQHTLPLLEGVVGLLLVTPCVARSLLRILQQISWDVSPKHFSALPRPLLKLSDIVFCTKCCLSKPYTHRLTQVPHTAVTQVCHPLLAHRCKSSPYLTDAHISHTHRPSPHMQIFTEYLLWAYPVSWGL